MKITFEGFYGFKNAGDDAFVEVASWGAAKYWNCKKSVFLGAALPETIEPIIKEEWASKIKGLDRIAFLRHYITSNYLISAGGSTFSNIPSHSNRSIAQKYTAVTGSLKLGAIGVSIGPFANTKAEKNVINYLKSLTFLALRDQRSFEYATSLQLPYSPVNAFDLAALLPSVYDTKLPVQREEEAKKTIGISICNYERYTGGDISKEQQRNNFFRKTVELLLQNQNLHLKVFIINGNSTIGDWSPTEALLEGIDTNRYNIIPYLGNVKKTWDEIAECDFMLSTRLHAGIFACYARVPFILIEYHQKCSDFLNDVGQDEALRVFDAQKSPKEASEAILQALEGKLPKPSRIMETIARSEKNFTETLFL